MYCREFNASTSRLSPPALVSASGHLGVCGTPPRCLLRFEPLLGRIGGGIWGGGEATVPVKYHLTRTKHNMEVAEHFKMSD